MNFDKAMKLDPQYEVAVLGKGAALTEMGKCDEAIKVFDNLIMTSKNPVKALDGKAHVYYRLARIDD